MPSAGASSTGSLPPANVLADAHALAAELAAGPTFGNAMTKRMLEMEWAMSVETAIEAEAVAQALCMETEDFVRAYPRIRGEAQTGVRRELNLPGGSS